MTIKRLYKKINAACTLLEQSIEITKGMVDDAESDVIASQSYIDMNVLENCLSLNTEINILATNLSSIRADLSENL